MVQGFGQLIRQARKDKGYSQRELAKLVNLDFTYLSKLENDRADYPPKEGAIRLLAKHLELNAEELIFLAGRIPERDEDILKENYKAMPALFRRMRKDPDFAQKVFSMAHELTHGDMRNSQEVAKSKNQED
ncbi:MAG: helix-turn-helix transcriptional regulator [Chroococcidiopsidaceae cyanobacterium CP_BM_RX_35]|nr:helix-turn-helix transcriptional regulator [Chroococcidiopsidaceae cyanobacterium CP_BM_RX_35]